MGHQEEVDNFVKMKVRTNLGKVLVVSVLNQVKILHWRNSYSKSIGIF